MVAFPFCPSWAAVGEQVTAGYAAFFFSLYGTRLSVIALALGQYVIGTFTASSATENFTLVGSGTGDLTFPMMNALQLRTVAVPEPSTYFMVLAGLSCGGYSIWRRRMRA